MRQVDDTISLNELREMAERMFGTFVKADVDIARGLMVVDAELHADIEAKMLESGSAQEDLWGINLYPDQYGTDEFIEFDSMINIRPSQKNFSRYIEDSEVRQVITELVSKKVINE